MKLRERNIHYAGLYKGKRGLARHFGRSKFFHLSDTKFN